MVVLTLVHRNDQLLTRLADEARTDTLTGLINRRGFEERASLELAHARRDGPLDRRVAFDIDYFKRVNDEWGHEIGDRVLVRIGELLTSAVHGTSTSPPASAARSSSCCCPAARASDAEAFAERVRATPLRSDDATGLPTVRLSAGILAAVRPATIEVMLQGADSALYGAKRAGRDRIVIADRQEGARAQVFNSSSPTPLERAVCRRARSDALHRVLHSDETRKRRPL